MSSDRNGSGRGHSYNANLVNLVVSGYSAIEKHLVAEIGRGSFERGSTLKEVIHKMPSVKPILDSDGFVEFKELLAIDIGWVNVDFDSVVLALWAILENDCKEVNLRACVVADKASGLPIVVLA